MNDSLDILIDIARKSGSKFTPILKYESKEEAFDVCSDFGDSCDHKDVVFSVEEENGVFYLGISFKDVMNCGGELDEYCKVCKTVHFDKKGLTSAELEKKKKDFYAKWSGRIRDKSKITAQ